MHCWQLSKIYQAIGCRGIHWHPLILRAVGGGAIHAMRVHVRGCRWVGGGACAGPGVEVRRWIVVGGARRGAGVEVLRLRWRGCRRPGGRRLLASTGFGHDSDGFLGAAAGQRRRRPAPPLQVRWGAGQWRLSWGQIDGLRAATRKKRSSTTTSTSYFLGSPPHRIVSD